MPLQTDPDCAAPLHRDHEPPRREHAQVAADLRSTGELRPELSDRYVADVTMTAGF
jgi:hypothetical protein